jgi:hypothetical protein
MPAWFENSVPGSNLIFHWSQLNIYIYKPSWVFTCSELFSSQAVVPCLYLLQDSGNLLHCTCSSSFFWLREGSSISAEMGQDSIFRSLCLNNHPLGAYLLLKLSFLTSRTPAIPFTQNSSRGDAWTWENQQMGARISQGISNSYLVQQKMDLECSNSSVYGLHMQSGRWCLVLVLHFLRVMTIKTLRAWG